MKILLLAIVTLIIAEKKLIFTNSFKMQNKQKSPVFNGLVLKDLRIKKNLSVYELSKLSGMDKAKIHRLEKGTILEPRYGSVAAIALALEVSMDVFTNKLSL